MDWHRYVRSHYREDLTRFLKAFGNRSEEDFISCLPCALPSLRSAFASADLSDCDAFAANLALEAVLTAGVHCYDTAHHAPYVESVGLRIYLQDHGIHGMRRPHQLLALLPDTPSSAELVRSSVTSLVPAWIQAYERLFGPGNGSKVVRGLAGDPHIAQTPEATPDRLVAAFREGLSSVAAGLPEHDR